jgi:DNA-binding NtrC family response regulator
MAVDARIVASTNRDLAGEIAAGRFREDLYYRLNVVHIALPPLRARRGDIPFLVDHLVERLNTKLGTRFIGVAAESLRSLIDRPWKGNVRELENVLEQAMVFGETDLVEIPPLGLDAAPEAMPSPDLRAAVRQFERRHVRDVLVEAGGDKREAARRLGISLASLYRKLGV